MEYELTVIAEFTAKTLAATNVCATSCVSHPAVAVLTILGPPLMRKIAQILIKGGLVFGEQIRDQETTELLTNTS